MYELYLRKAQSYQIAIAVASDAFVSLRSCLYFASPMASDALLVLGTETTRKSSAFLTKGFYRYELPTFRSIWPMSCYEPVYWSSWADSVRSNALLVSDPTLVHLKCRVGEVGVGGRIGDDQGLLLPGAQCAQALLCRVELRRRLDGEVDGHRRIAGSMVKNKNTLTLWDYTKG